MSNTEKKSDMQLLASLRTGGDAVWKETYKDFRGKFINWASGRYGLAREDYEDIAQESFEVLYYNIRKGKLSELNSSLETYFFAIGKNKIRDRYKKKMRTWEEIESTPRIPDLDLRIDEKIELNYRNAKLDSAMKQLGEACQRVLYLFYFREFTMESIANELEYSTEQGAKNKKLKCLKQLRKILGLTEI